MAHFRSAGDVLGAQRAAMLLACAEFALAGGHGSAGAARRATRAARYRHRRDCARRRRSSSRTTCRATRCTRSTASRIREDRSSGAARTARWSIEAIRRRARARGDRFFEVSRRSSLAAIAQRKGDVVRAAALYESVLPMIERERNPELYAALAGRSRRRADRARRIRSRAGAALRGARVVRRARRRQPARRASWRRSPPSSSAAATSSARSDTIESALAAVRALARPGRPRIGAAARGQRRGRARPPRSRARLPARRRSGSTGTASPSIAPAC